MDWTLEVVVVPVADVDRAVAFYRDQLGFNLDHDTQAGDQRFVQLTPPGSGCSIVLSDPPPMAPGSLKGVQLIVADAYLAHNELIERGVAAGDIDVIDERDGGTLFGFSDPDGNSWVVQQIKARADAPLLPR
ncbi:MAG TPA: VOC family protein [Mycobacterium sp.]|jgi:catechol 2,3-dioxygenase-like lactoylglutathione lyase family enzyme|nr:VOC family protein [Mycobacterium sp.]